ncbi:LegC family aminotransferase [Roseibium sp. FZY0029]|uniref:LegC family aminotransferase n=1 Tax=Roseibium sp. FZY0029 TaxID=3116647 RepID=UPI002EC70FA6|nr:LegC family aminotransferase [Roseibium sp. FZY0029]
MSKLDDQKILRLLNEVTGRPRGTDDFVPLHEPRFSGNEWVYVKECLNTGWVSSVGSYVDLFEEKVAEAFGVKKAICMVNGTAALHIALLMAGVAENDEVIVPALTFVASANAITYCRAIPHFVDSELATLGLDPDALDSWLDEVAEFRENETFNRRTGRRIAAIVPMHTFGHPVRMSRLLEVAAKWSIPVVEDAAESIGSRLNGNLLGGLGLVGATSFNGNKTITTGGGGALLTNDIDLANKAKHIATTAKKPHKWRFYHDRLGFNYRLPNINAALGCAQLEQVSEVIAAKRHLALAYEAAFKDIEGLRFVVEPEHSQSNYWLNAVILDDPSARDPFLEVTNEQGFGTRPCWMLMNELPMYRNCPSSPLSISQSISSRLVNIPSSAYLGLKFVKSSAHHN